MEPPKEKVSSVSIKRKKKYLGCSLLEHFELGQKVGVGTFGEVLKAKHSSNGKVVALKKIFTKSEQEGFPITSLREIKLLKNVSHPNVASLIDMAVSYKTDGNDFKEVEDIYMVFPFMDHDLTGILENQNISLNLPQIKCYMKQMLEGISYLHQSQIMHRDLKGANLLVNNRGELKITDFGLARPLEENRVKYTPGVVTRWYRPPELLFGSDVYNEAVDIWGAGCIIAEMYIRKPLFGASSDLDQLKLVCMYCGTATEESYPGVSELPDFSKIQLKPEKRILREYLESKKLDKAAVDLIDKMLVMDPKQRITAKEALAHEYFKCDPMPCSPSEIGQFESSHVYTVQQQQQLQSAHKKSRTDHHEERHRRSHYDDHDSRHHHHHNRHENTLRYSEHLPPPPPPPPPPVSTLRDRHVGSHEHQETQRHDIRRSEDIKHSDSRHGDSRISDNRISDSRYSDTRHSRHTDTRHSETRNPETRYSDHHETRHYEHPRHYPSDHRRIDLHRSSSHDSVGERRVFSESRSRSRSPERRRLPEPSESSATGRRAISYDDL